MRKILMISYSFPPTNNIFSRWYGEMVPHMPKFGWEPFIITTNNSRGDLPVDIPEKNIIRVGTNDCVFNQNSIVHKNNKSISKILRPLYSLYKKYKIEIRSIDNLLFTWRKK